MTEAKLKKTVGDALALDREIKEKQAELSELEGLLSAEAESRKDEHAETEMGGWSWTATDEAGNIVRVTQNGKTLKSKMSADKDIQKAKELSGVIFNRLFMPSVSFKPIESFRNDALSLLGTKGKKLIALLTTSGRRTVSYETKE